MSTETNDTTETVEVEPVDPIADRLLTAGGDIWQCFKKEKIDTSGILRKVDTHRIRETAMGPNEVPYAENPFTKSSRFFVPSANDRSWLGLKLITEDTILLLYGRGWSYIQTLEGVYGFKYTENSVNKKLWIPLNTEDRLVDIEGLVPILLLMKD